MMSRETNKEQIMEATSFDLNDIEHEPTDEQLETLMQAVALEAKRRAQESRQELMRRLRADIAAANGRPAAA